MNANDEIEALLRRNLIDKGDGILVQPKSWDEYLKYGSADSPTRMVRKDEQDGVELSTVKLIAAAFTNEHYETMIFGGERDEECHKYARRSKAIEGHERIKAELWGTDNLKGDEHGPTTI